MGSSQKHSYIHTNSLNDPSNTLTIKSLFPSAPWSTHPIEMLNIFFHFHKLQISLYSISQSKKIHVLDIANCYFQVPMLHYMTLNWSSFSCLQNEASPPFLYHDILLYFYLKKYSRYTLLIKYIYIESTCFWKRHYPG